MYDGYHFHPQGEGIYNPFSLLKAFDERNLGAYWFATGTPTFLVRRLKTMHFDVRQFTQKTLETNDRILSDYRTDNPNPCRFCTRRDTSPLWTMTPRHGSTPWASQRGGQIRLFGKPPARVHSEAGSGNGKDIFALRRRLLAGDTDGMREILTALFASIPYTSNDAPSSIISSRCYTWSSPCWTSSCNARYTAAGDGPTA
ncbi:hypothetical protein [Selenomonas sp. AB3002]|uniref:hypothetical protein n=1 Tax=Selenomonas sp. AB3002 TaxID=1392502 RepID=UPI000ABE19BA